MNNEDLTRERWGRLLAQLDDPAVGQVAEALADAFDLAIGDAYDHVEEALDDGPLDEDTSAGAFGVIHVENGKNVETTAEDTETEDETPTPEADKTPSNGGKTWDDADFTATEADVFPSELLEREQWMGRAGESGKLPFAPWADRDHPEAAEDEDARWKWGLVENYANGHTVAIAEDDPRLDGRVFLQKEEDPYAFVDGDDVRCPETGEVHPEFIAILERLGATYADVSTSGTGVHANYRGELPEDLPEAKWALDEEPWGANEDEPSIEIYANKHVCVLTGDHVPGTPVDVCSWDDEKLEALLDEYDQLPEDPRDPSTERDDYDLEDHDPDATDADETTDDIRDIFVALDRLDAKRVAGETIVDEWNDDASTSDGARAFYPTWGSSSDSGTANYVNGEIWHDTGDAGGYGGPAVMAAIDDNLISHRGASPSDVRGATWFNALEHLRDGGFSIPKLERGGADEEGGYRRDPRDVDVVLEPQRAWRAAELVDPQDLPADAIALGESDDGDGWICPATDATVDVVRAAAIDAGIVDDAQEPLGEDYALAYAKAREVHGAPLPQYVTAADAVGRFDVVIGAVRELNFWHLDRDALTAGVTGEGLEVSGEAVLTLDPTPVDGWRDSQSGESVLVFESGTVYDADGQGGEGAVIDALRFVALDAGIVDEPSARLEGETFTEAYRAAREDYGAPLPRWNAGAPDVTPVLPPAEDLVEAPDVDGDELEELRDDVEELYQEAANDAEEVSLLRVLPALGKTTAAIKTAAERPTTYLAPRKDLMEQAAEKAEKWGATYRHLPVFGGGNTGPAVEEAVEDVREQGKERLRDRWALLDAAGGEVFPEEDDEDDVDLDRATCSTAEGEHGEAWALAVHVARCLDYTPRDIHERAAALFGSELPCQDGDDCEYSQGWDAVADPDAPADLLIGHYGHAHVESARTYYTRGDGDGRTQREARTVVLDEFPGLAYADKFGDEALDHAVWLAQSLRDDVEDRQDLLERDLWGDEFVRSWLRGEAAEEGGPTHDTMLAIGARRKAHEAASNAEEILERYDGLLESHDLRETLERARDRPDMSAQERRAAAAEISTTVEGIAGDVDGFAALRWADEDVARPLAESANYDLTPDLDVLPEEGELREFVERAVEAADEGEEHAATMLAAAEDALAGGDAGVRELAVWAEDGHAHRDAHYLLEAVVRPLDDGAERLTTSHYFAEDGDSTTVKRVHVDGVTVVLDRNHRGAEVHKPPARTAGGDDVPVVGLDATGRAPLWKVALGDDVVVRDVHETLGERAECLREVHRLQMVQTTDLTKSYEGDPDGKNLDGDVALLEHISDKFAGVYGGRDRDEEDLTLNDPAAITTKVVREVLEDDERAEDVTSAWENYGNLKGSNDLREHQLAALLGCQHYGDREVERFAAFAGEEAERHGYGNELDYGGEIANEYLGHMREDQVMQAALRFARGGSGALVFAHTAALRDDLPVVGEGQVVKSWSSTATEIAKEWQRTPGEEFTAGDVAEAVDVSRRQVRRVLAEFVEAGYLERHDPGEGLANEFSPMDTPGAGEAEMSGDLRPEATGDPGQEDIGVSYTANVRVEGVDSADLPRATGVGSTLPAPDALDGPPTPASSS